MTNPPEPRRHLTLSILICMGRPDHWLDGRIGFRTGRHILNTLGGVAGLRRFGMGGSSDNESYHFVYGDLAAAVNLFVRKRGRLWLPEGTELIHYTGMEAHLMIRWTSEGLYPVYTDLSDDNLYSRLAICRLR